MGKSSDKVIEYTANKANRHKNKPAWSGMKAMTAPKIAAAAPKIAAPEIYFSLLEAQRGIIPIFFRYINCKKYY